MLCRPLWDHILKNVYVCRYILSCSHSISALGDEIINPLPIPPIAVLVNLDTMVLTALRSSPSDRLDAQVLSNKAWKVRPIVVKPYALPHFQFKHVLLLMKQCQ
jgi:hypothetical protein